MVSKAMDVLQAVDDSSRERRWKGVRKRAWGRYVCEIRLPRSRQRVWLGSYATAEEAACAYDAATLCLRGTTASLNFPSSMSPPLLRDSTSNQLPLSREAIQSIAAAAAAQCRNLQPNAIDAEKLGPQCRNPQPNAIVAEKLGPQCRNPQPNAIVAEKLLPLLSDLNQLPKCAKADEARVQASSVPAEQLSSPEEILTSATGAEDDQCVFSILKELVALPMIFNAYGAPIC